MNIPSSRVNDGICGKHTIAFRFVFVFMYFILFYYLDCMYYYDKISLLPVLLYWPGVKRSKLE